MTDAAASQATELMDAACREIDAAREQLVMLCARLVGAVSVNPAIRALI